MINSGDWNPAFKFIMKIKRDYINTFGKVDVYNLDVWIEKLNKNEYNDFRSRVNLSHADGCVLVKYNMINVGSDMWEDPNSMYREMRSLVIDLVDDAIVAAPFRKFFNMGEVKETRQDMLEEMIRKARNVDISNKFDGSMQFARWYKNNVQMFGSKAMEDEKSFRLAEGRSWLTKQHIAMIKSSPKITFIFEYISMNDQHVVHYSEDQQGLYLIGMRDITNGLQLQSRYVKQTANKFGIKYAKLEEGTLTELLEKVKKYKSNEKEGWVLNIDGFLCKIKCDDYVYIHRILSKVSSINLVIHSIADGTYDDLIAKVPETYRPRIDKAVILIRDYVLKTEKEVIEWYHKSPKKDRKEFMIWVDSQVPKNLNRYVKCKYLGQEYNLLKSGNPKSPKYINMHHMGYDVNYSVIFGDE